MWVHKQKVQTPHLEFLSLALRSQATDKGIVIHLQLVGSLLLLNLLLLASMSLAWEDSLLCKVLGGLLHYALLTCFSWMGLEALHLYRLLVQVYNIYTKHYLLKISLLGWGTPAFYSFILLFIQSVNHLDIC